uniref:Vesicle transport protein n=1 Tax=Macrostomum lignano TaxID=282301 RepID=A0A1I8F9S8_9PLAT
LLFRSDSRAAHSVETACPTGSQCTASSSNSSRSPEADEDPTSQDFEESRGLKAQQPPPPPPSLPMSHGHNGNGKKDSEGAAAGMTSSTGSRLYQSHIIGADMDQAVFNFCAWALTIFSYVIAGLTFPLSLFVCLKISIFIAAASSQLHRCPCSLGQLTAGKQKQTSCRFPAGRLRHRSLAPPGPAIFLAIR